MPDFITVPHTADIQIRAFGSTLQELYFHALQGMFHVIEPRTTECKTINDRLVCDTFSVKHEIHIDAPDKEALLVDFLSDALFLSDLHNEAYLDVTFSLFNDTQLHAMVHGVKITGFAIEIKAVTYHNMHIKQVDGVWQTDIVFDI